MAGGGVALINNSTYVGVNRVRITTRISTAHTIGKPITVHVCQDTLDTYGHVMQRMRRDSANRMQNFYEQLSK